MRSRCLDATARLRDKALYRRCLLSPSEFLVLALLSFNDRDCQILLVPPATTAAITATPAALPPPAAAAAAAVANANEQVLQKETGLERNGETPRGEGKEWR